MDKRKKIIVIIILFLLTMGIFIVSFWQSKKTDKNLTFTFTRETGKTENSEKSAPTASIKPAGFTKEEQKIIDLKMEETKSSAKYAPLLFEEGKDDNLNLTSTSTSAYNLDTDGDGVTDGEEINIYHTDPFKADTDGDGFNDGDEVRRGYNPKGKD